MTEDSAVTLTQVAKAVAVLNERMKNGFKELDKRMDNEFKHMADDIKELKGSDKTLRNRLLGWMWTITILVISSIVGFIFFLARMWATLVAG